MKFYKLTLCALALMGAVACNDGGDVVNSNQGALVFDMNANQNVEEVTRASISAVTGYTAPTKEEFTFTVTNDDGYDVWSGKITELSEGKLTLDAGTYSVKAVYNEMREDLRDYQQRYEKEVEKERIKPVEVDNATD